MRMTHCTRIRCLYCMARCMSHIGDMIGIDKEDSAISDIVLDKHTMDYRTCKGGWKNVGMCHTKLLLTI